MIFLRTNTDFPPLNLATEEYYLKNSADDYFMLWQNSPVVVIGKNQNVYDEVDLDYAREHSVYVVRRITGGGAVYHDQGNVNYSFITSASKASSLDFEYFTRPVILALESLGVHASLSGRNDLVAGGAKISGSAQYSTGSRILHHGTLLFDADLDILSKVLKPAPQKFLSKNIQSVRSRVVNVRSLCRDDISGAGEFMDALEKYVCDYFGCSPAVSDEAAVRSSGLVDKYLSEDYNFGRRKHYAFKREKRFPFGTLAVCFDVAEGVISDIRFEGDFFSLIDTDPLVAFLQGAPYTKSGLLGRLDQIGVERYFPSIVSSDLADLILER